MKPDTRYAWAKDGIARAEPTLPSAPATPGQPKAFGRLVVRSPRPTVSCQVLFSRKFAVSADNFGPSDFRRIPEGAAFILTELRFGRFSSPEIIPNFSY